MQFFSKRYLFEEIIVFFFFLKLTVFPLINVVSFDLILSVRGWTLKENSVENEFVFHPKCPSNNGSFLCYLST